MTTGNLWRRNGYRAVIRRGYSFRCPLPPPLSVATGVKNKRKLQINKRDASPLVVPCPLAPALRRRFSQRLIIASGRVWSPVIEIVYTSRSPSQKKSQVLEGQKGEMSNGFKRWRHESWLTASGRATAVFSQTDIFPCGRKKHDNYWHEKKPLFYLFIFYSG